MNSGTPAKGGVFLVILFFWSLTPTERAREMPTVHFQTLLAELDANGQGMFELPLSS